ncbi:MAG: cell division protein FtsA [bacterium]
MIRNISVGIDIGTNTTRVVVGEFLKGEKNPKIIGVGESETKGMRHGYIVNVPEAVSSLKKAVLLAEKTSEIKIKRAFIAIGGTTLRSEITSGSAIISKADSEVTNLDISKALEECETNLALGNKKIIYEAPLSFKLDGKEVLGKPEGMHGNKLEIKAVFITSSAKHWEDLMDVIAGAGVEPVYVTSSIMAGSHLVLSSRQRMVGTALVDIGAETVSLGVFENESLISLHTFPIGSSDITNDIALGLKIPLEKAEIFKISNNGEEYSKKKLDEIVEARLTDIFELIENHLKKIKRNELLPAGIVFIGGGSNISELDFLSKNILKLPSKVGTTEIFGNTKTKLRDPSWYVALGLITSSKDKEDYVEGSIPNLLKDLKTSLKSMVKQLMP